MDIRQADREYIIGTYRRQEPVLVRGRGARCWDQEGKEYLDFGAGIGVNSLGFCDPEWADAVAAQARTLQHASNLYYTLPGVELAKTLCLRTGYRKALFCNSGAEANECAIKLARKYSFDKYGPDSGRNKILCLGNSFHGRTVTTLSATGQDVFHNYYFPFTEGFAFAPANDLDAALALLEQGGFCGVLVELIQGEGGVNPLEPHYVSALSGYCREHDLLLLADEVQTGIGRTGQLLASRWFQDALGAPLLPDITTLAKGLGGGLPIGAVLTNERTCNVMGPSDHGTTFGGNPVACAGALTVMSRLSDAFLEEVRRKGEILRHALGNIPEIAGISGLGLMLGVSLRTQKAPEVVKECIRLGLLPLTAKEKVRLLPPLSITDEELSRGADILRQALT